MARRRSRRSLAALAPARQRPWIAGAAPYAGALGISPVVLRADAELGLVAILFLLAIVWATDIVEGIDPFKIFKPQVLGLAGVAFVGAVLVLSLFTYRPWCHFFCPFGLAGWVAEKMSRIRPERWSIKTKKLESFSRFQFRQ